MEPDAPVINGLPPPENDLKRELAACRIDDESFFLRHFRNAEATGEDFSNIEFRQVRLENCRLGDADFSGGTFIDVLFIDCDLANCDFSRANFRRCEFRRVKGLGARFTDGILRHWAADDGNFAYADFSDARLEQVRFKGCDLTEAAFSHCRLKNFTLQENTLVRTGFFHTPLRGVDFIGNRLEAPALSRDGSELAGAVVDLFQAAELAKLFGIVIR